MMAKSRQFLQVATIQGSTLGPKYFDIYTDDLNSLFENDENVMYADDTTVVGEDLSVLESHVNSGLSEVLRLVSIK